MYTHCKTGYLGTFVLWDQNVVYFM